MSEKIPVFKFGGRTLQGFHRFGSDEQVVLRECHELTDVNDIYRLLEKRRNQARARRLREVVTGFILPLYETGITPVIVVSAFDWATDKLDQLSRYIATRPVEREYARLLMSGELRANSSLAMALCAGGIPAHSMTGREAGVVTENKLVGALIEKVDDTHVHALVAQRIVPVVAGFQGYCHDPETGRDEVSILGRGGSNLTAVALAAALGQTEVTMCSNVEGIYDRDPFTDNSARKLAEVSGRELLAWSDFPQVIQREAVEYALAQGVDIWIRSGFDPHASGTRIVCSG